MNKKLKENFIKSKMKLGLMENVSCDAQENLKYNTMQKNGKPLPKNVFVDPYSMDGTQYYKCIESNLTIDELDEYLKCINTNNIRTIKNCLVYFSILVTIPLVLSLVALLVSLASM